jgi:hypothetical protein
MDDLPRYSSDMVHHYTIEEAKRKYFVKTNKPHYVVCAPVEWIPQLKIITHIVRTTYSTNKRRYLVNIAKLHQITMKKLSNFGCAGHLYGREKDVTLNLGGSRTVAILTFVTLHTPGLPKLWALAYIV